MKRLIVFGFVSLFKQNGTSCLLSKIAFSFRVLCQTKWFERERKRKKEMKTCILLLFQFTRDKITYMYINIMITILCYTLSPTRQATQEHHQPNQ